MKKFIYILFSLLELSSCVRALDDTCSMPVAGMWASLDENGFVSEYIEFKKGNYKTFEAESPGYYSEGKVWAAEQSSFKKVSQDEYSIIDGILYVRNSGYPISVKDSVMVIDDIKYYTLKEFTSDYYSTITCSYDECYTYDYTAAEIIWDYEVDNCPFGNSVHVSAEAEWINSIAVTDEFISLEIDENLTGEARTAEVTLTYPSAEPLVLTLSQACAEPKIVLDQASMSCDYHGGDFEFGYEIVFPKDELSVEVECEVEWIADISVNEGIVTFTVKENNSGAERSCDIVLCYGDLRESYNVVQTYSATCLELSSKSMTVDYHEAKGCVFNGKIENPRKEYDVKVSCAEEWIADLQYIAYTDVNFKVEFTVKENCDIEPERYAYIRVEYGDVSEIFKVEQTNDRPVIRLSSSLMECEYVEGSYDFSYVIENPRSSFIPEIHTDASWITDLADDKGKVSFVVSENNSKAERTGNVIVTYGNVTESFKVVQKYSVSGIELTPKHISVNYHENRGCCFDGKILNPRKDGKVKVSCSEDWITDLHYKPYSETSFKVDFTVKENNDLESERRACINVEYNGVSETVTVEQTCDRPVIKMVNTGQKCSYSEGSYSFTYSIENPRESIVAKVTSNSSWITGLVDKNGTVSFTVAENNTGYSRVDEITISYGSVSAKFIVDQEYQAPVILLDAVKREFDYKGGSSVIEYYIKNHRKSMKVSVSCNADWVKVTPPDGASSSGRISFDVSQNSGSDEFRTADIEVYYGTFVETISITQTNESPVIKMINTGQQCTYAEDSYSFTYSIENPRESYTAKVKTNYPWIIELNDENGKVTFTVSENNTGYNRVGEIIIEYGSATAKFVVDQDYSRPEIFLTAAKSEFDYKGGSSFIEYVVRNPRQGMKVSVSCSSDWLKITPPDGSETYGKIYFEVAENVSSQQSRTAYVTVSYGTVYQSISVTQANEAPVIKMSSPVLSCNYSEGSYSFNYTIENQRESFSAKVRTGASWITGLSDSNGTVSFNVEENNSGNDRIGEIIIEYGNVNAKFIVEQKYTSPVVILMARQSQFDYTGGSSVVEYAIQNPRKNMKVSVSCDYSWVKIISRDGTDTSGKIYFDVAENDGKQESRTAYLIVSYGTFNETIAITQSNEAPVIKLIDTGGEYGYEESIYSFSYTIDNPRESIVPKATVNADWIQILSANDGKVKFLVNENNYGERYAEIILAYGSASVKFIVIQKYVQSELLYEVSQRNFDYKGGSAVIEYYIRNPRKDAVIKVSCEDSWVKNISYNGKETDGKIYFDVSENISDKESRTTCINIVYGTVYEGIDITQSNELPVIKMVEGGKEFGYAETAYSFDFTIENPRESFTATAVQNAEWIRDLSVSNGKVSFTVAENNSEVERYGEITVTYGNVSAKFHVIQKYQRPSIYLHTDKSTFDYKGGSSVIEYYIQNPRKDAKITVSCDAEWVKILSQTGTETNGRITFEVSENNDKEIERGAQIYVVYATTGEVLSISQTNDPPVIKVEKEAEVFDYKGGSSSFSFTVENPRDHLTASVRQNVGWISGLTLKDGVVSFSVSENNDGGERIGEIIITYGSATARFIVAQQYVAPSLYAGAVEDQFDYTGGSSCIIYHIENPRKDMKVNVYCNADWLTFSAPSGSETQGEIRFDVAANNGSDPERSAMVYVSYGDIGQTVPIYQTNEQPVIKVEKEAEVFDYKGGSSSFSFIVENPRDHLTASVSQNVGWISDLKLSGHTVSFSVSENNDGGERIGEIIITYGSASARFIVAQQYVAPVLYAGAVEDQFDYTGGSSCIIYHIENPRKDMKVNVYCNADWLTFSAPSGSETQGEIHFNVAPNNSNDPERTAMVYVSYGDIGYSVTIYQTNEQPVIKVEKEAEVFDYKGGSSSFSFTVENPRDHLAASVQQNVGWISDLTLKNGTVSYSVSENNEGAERIGEIIITYGSATARFIVAQKYVAPSLYAEANKNEFDYTGGSSYIIYHIENPRKDMKVHVYCDADWLTFGALSGSETHGEIHFDVAANNGSDPERSAMVYVSYGDIGQAVTIYQTNEQPKIILEKEAIGFDYTGGSGSFSFSIENPRDHLTASVTQNVGWISGLTLKDGVVSFSVSENNDGAERIGEIIITYGSASARFIVAQKYVAPSLYAEANKNEFDYTGGSSYIFYHVDNPRKDVKISAYCESDWLTVSTPSGSETQGEIHFNVAPNNSSDPERSAMVYVSYGDIGQAVTIYQTNEQPKIILEKEAIGFDYTGGSGSFTFTIENPRDHLTASIRQNVGWISGLTLKDGVVSFSVSENNEGAERIGEIIITYGSASARFIVAQKYVAPSLYAEANKNEFDYTGGSSYIFYHVDNPRKDVKISTYCESDWLTVSTPSGSETQGEIHFNVAPNNSSDPERSAMVYVSYGDIGQAVTIYQTNAQPVIKVEKESEVFDYKGGSSSFSFTIENPRDHLTASVTQNVGWISGLTLNNGVVSFSVSENNDGGERIGEIIITYGSASARFIVAQQYVAPSLYAEANKNEFDYTGGSSYIFYHVDNPRKDMKISAYCESDWLTVSTPSGSETQGEIHFNVAPNNGSDPERSAMVYVSYGDIGQAVAIYQTNEQPKIMLEKEAIGFDYTGGSGSFTFTIENPRDHLTASVRQNVGWISGLTLKDGVVSFSVSENNDGGERIGEIIITYGSASARFIVAQQYVAPSLYTGAVEDQFDYTGGSSYIIYHIENPRKDMKVNVYCDADWLTFGALSGSETHGEIHFDVAPNNSSDPERSAMVYVSYGDIGQTVPIYQTNAQPEIKLPNTGMGCGYESGTHSFNFTIENPRDNMTATARPNVDWISISSVNNGVVSFNVSENNDGGERAGEIVITYGSASARFVVFQEYAEISLIVVNPSTYLAREGGSVSFDYIIENPRATLKTSVTCDRNWITDLKYREENQGNIKVGTVTFTVPENVSSGERSANIYVVHGNRQADHYIHQE